MHLWAHLQGGAFELLTVRRQRDGAEEKRKEDSIREPHYRERASNGFTGRQGEARSTLHYTNKRSVHPLSSLGRATAPRPQKTAYKATLHVSLTEPSQSCFACSQTTCSKVRLRSLSPRGLRFPQIPLLSITIHISFHLNLRRKLSPHPLSL